MPEPNRKCGVAIVGGGCSGLLVATQLFRNGCRSSVTVIEPREQLGAGLAYSTRFDNHLLNVPAGKMSAFPGEPGHFLEWLRKLNWPDAAGDAFIPRKAYGLYLNDVLRGALEDAPRESFSHIREEVTEIESAGQTAVLRLGDGSTLQADRVVLAIGNPASSAASVIPRGHNILEDHLNLSPWLEDALTIRFPGERILLIGSGLTAVDSVVALQSQKAGCSIYMLSRRGILPQVHNLRFPAGAPPALRNRGELLGLFREVRALIREARQAELCWRTIVDSLRPLSNELWKELSAADRKRFLRHLKTYWEPHRHRMAPGIRARLNDYLAAGKVQVIAGRVREIRSRGPVAEAHIRRRSGEECTLEVDRVISCTGIHEDYTKSPRPLVRSMMQAGLARANELGIGFDTDENGALLDASTRPSNIFFTLGPPRRGDLFETTAVPEIRSQAESLARHLLASMASRDESLARSQVV
ncbi:MAG TPA: FAD/NAD(P)-binding protein [Bryobacteraceae bacterium]|nr:FAD/NAD(P)-binding protein [Bryobacteraceae bacterium]